MFQGNGYYEALNCSSLMQGALAHGSSQVLMPTDSTSQHDMDNIKVTSFAIEDLCNTASISTDVALEIGLEDHIAKELPTENSTAWGQSMCNVHQHSMSHQISEDQHDNSAHLFQEFNAVSFSNGEYAAAHDLLNNLQIPACTTNSLPPTYHMIYDTAMKPVDCLDLNINLSGVSNHTNGVMINDSTLNAGYVSNQTQLFKDLNYTPLQNCELLVKTEKERREQINVKYDELKSLLPSPTKPDRASVVGAAIDYINELNGTIKELNYLLERKKYGNKREKVTLEGNSSADMESSSMKPYTDDQEQEFNEMISSSWVQRKTKECHIDVRRVDDEVNIKIYQKIRTNSLLCILLLLTYCLVVCRFF